MTLCSCSVKHLTRYITEGRTLTPEERLYAKKTARIIRAARKQLSLNQQTVATRLGISQSALSKLEHATLIPSAPQWFEFCRMTSIAPESLLTGYIERNRLATLDEANREGTFKLPKRYSLHRGSKVRAILPFLTFLRSVYEEDKVRDFLKSTMKVDPDFFVDLDNQLNLRFILDLAKHLIEQKHLRVSNLSKLTRPVNQPEMHGSLQRHYSGTMEPVQLLSTLFSSSRHYECNFRYRIEDQKRQWFDFSVEPEKHLADFGYKNDSTLGDFLCKFKRSYFERFLQFGDAAEKQPVVEALECHHHGASRCVYRVTLPA